jgi:DNA-binding LacI/PurR family transcriptional regulator
MVYRVFMADSLADYEAMVVRCLAAAPHALGHRLKPELQLCEVFGLGRWQTRAVLDRLVKKGVITRRRGSGTFVKRIPRATASQADGPAMEADRLLVSHDDPAEPLSRIARHHDSRSLDIGLWSEWTNSNQSLQAILAGMIEHANRSRHILTAHSMLMPNGEGKPVEEVIAAVNASKCDGAIFGFNFFADHQEAFRKCQKPIALHYPGSMPLHDKPSVSIDIESAVFRAVTEFAAQGYRRVAILGLQTKYHDSIPERSALERAVVSQGVKSGGYFECDHQNVQSCLKAAAALMKSGVDAVYISDDVVLSIISPFLRTVGDRIGNDFGIITLANRGVVLPDWCQWSRLELDGWLFGRMVVDAISIHIESVQTRFPALQVRLNWSPGASHKRQ